MTQHLIKMDLLARLFGKRKAAAAAPAPAAPHSEEAYRALLQDCMDEVDRMNAELMERHGFGTFERWELDQQDGHLVFSSGGEIKLACKIQILGTYAEKSGTWMWGWANNSLLPHLTAGTMALHDYGHEHDLSDLSRAKLQGDLKRAAELAALGCQLLGGLGVYRGPTSKGCVMMMITKVISL